MIHGYLGTFGYYGSWYPNDPRGSKSKFVGSRQLYLAGGPATNDDRSQKGLTRDEFKQLRKLTLALKRQRVVLDELQIAQVCAAIDQFVSGERRVVWAVAVLSTHIHIAFGRARTSSEDFIMRLKQSIQDYLKNVGLLPAGCDEDHGMWAVGQWIDYLDSEREIDNAIHYTQANVHESALAPQDLKCIVPFAGIKSNIVSYFDEK